MTTADYKNTIALPRTDFPMRAGLPKKETELLARWAAQDLHGRVRAASAGRPSFILHDGPPYANGHLHIGHALNKILKDIINRCRQMSGRDARYVPGWDCHGLPIEWKIEERYRAAGQDKDAVPIAEFRKECRDFALEWLDIQRAEFKRLGIMGDWENPYTTMTFAAEARIAGEIGKFLLDGSLYRGEKPVLWSPVEKTALAEAEVEYQDHRSTTIHVRFPVVETAVDGAEKAALVIWTTTPWTIPGNRAIAYGPDIDYALATVRRAGPDGPLALEHLIVAVERLEDFKKAAGLVQCDILKTFPGKALEGTVCAHPLRGQGYDFNVPALPAAFATAEEGTGLVHVAPGHGVDDWALGRDAGIETPRTVGEDGCFYPHVPLFAGQHVYKVNDMVADVLAQAGALMARGSIVHRYPHSWRSKKPLIFRTTSQWFISMTRTGLRDTALKALEDVVFHPPQGRNRLRAMVENRPDWCISRQRAWGVPIPVFVHRESGEPLRDPAVVARVVDAFTREGADAWFTRDPADFLGPDHNPGDYEQVRDVVDVWFDSGSTHAFVLEDRPDLSSPADLYLEGSDQHRGWFQSSLLESCGTRGRAPYKAVLTHGFILAEDGRKMSKSLGNIVAPQAVSDRFGAEILRLWVVASDYSEDLRIGPELLARHQDSYRRLRNTLRWLLGNLNGFPRQQPLPDPRTLPELERWALHRLWEMDRLVREAAEALDFHRLFRGLHDFCANDLSAFYFDIRKDRLYCDVPQGAERQAALLVLDRLFDCLSAWLAPVLCFTAEEAWLSRTGAAPDNSVHLRCFPDIPANWRDDSLTEKWAVARETRRVVLGALERERAEGRIGSSLQASPVVHMPAEMLTRLQDLDMAEVAITSGISLTAEAAPADAFRLEGVADIAVTARPAEGEKCARCWKILPEVGQDPAHDGLCGRCVTAVAAYGQAA